jgi:hypothetical protein
MLMFEMTLQSAGTLSPDFRRMRSPMTIWEASVGFITPSRITLAWAGTMARNFSIRESDLASCE